MTTLSQHTRAHTIQQYSKTQQNKIPFHPSIHPYIHTQNHSRSIAFKPAESGWGGNSKYGNNYDSIFGGGGNSKTKRSNTDNDDNDNGGSVNGIHDNKEEKGNQHHHHDDNHVSVSGVMKKN